MKTTHFIAIGLLVAAVCLTGCTKTVHLTIMNHTDVSRQVQLTVPEGTMTLGSVGPEGTMTSSMKLEKDDLPAACNLSVGAGASQSFTVTDDSPKAWWFHVTKDGRLVGPLGQYDLHTETESGGSIELRSKPKMMVR